MTSVHLHTLTLALCLAVTGCSSVLTATRDDPIDDNRGTRTIGSTIDDSLIETKAAVNIAKAHPDLDPYCHCQLQRGGAFGGTNATRRVKAACRTSRQLSAAGQART